MRVAALIVTIALLVPAAAAQAATPRAIAAALERDPVYVEAGSEPTLTAPSRGACGSRSRARTSAA